MTHQEVCSLLGFEIDKDWLVEEVKRKGALAGIVLIRGNEIHCWRKPEYTGIWLTKHTIRNIIQPLINEYGSVSTKVTKSNNTGHTFVTRLGFEKVLEDENCTYYRIERLKHA